MIRWFMCYVFGHQPFEFHDQEENGTVTYTYYECARCAKRKTLDGRGWQ